MLLLLSFLFPFYFSDFKGPNLAWRDQPLDEAYVDSLCKEMVNSPDVCHLPYATAVIFPNSALTEAKV